MFPETNVSKGWKSQFSDLMGRMRLKFGGCLKTSKIGISRGRTGIYSLVVDIAMETMARWRGPQTWGSMRPFSGTSFIFMKEKNIHLDRSVLMNCYTLLRTNDEYLYDWKGRTSSPFIVADSPNPSYYSLIIVILICMPVSSIFGVTFTHQSIDIHW